MKKALVYAVTAILLSALTMVAPLIVLKPNDYGLLTSHCVKDMVASLEALTEAEGIHDERGALGIATSPSNLFSVGLMLIPSFLLALGTSLYIKKWVLS